MFDAIIVGGSFAGLSTAIYLARAQKSVCVIDQGRPRNRFTQASHGFFANDGANPKALIATMREQVAAYGTVTFRDGEAVAATGSKGAFGVTTSAGEVLEARRIVLAFGISDILPDIPGLAERWGSTVIHCPYCHGHEFAGQRLGVLNLSPASLHQGKMIPDWGPTTFLLNGSALSADDRAQLEARGVAIATGRVTRLEGPSGGLSAAVLETGEEVALDALFVGPQWRLNSAIAEQLGCELGEGPLGPLVSVDAMQQTSVPGVFAAGDIGRSAQNVTFACADGVMAAMATHASLLGDSA